MPKMIDASCDTTNNIEAMKEAGVTHIGRYYNNGNSAKCLIKVEAEALTAAGLQIVVVFQKAQDNVSCFNASEGTNAAYQALLCAAKVQQPLGSVIYFAVDFDATTEQVDNEITAYFTSVNKVLKGKFEVGVYGSGLVCSSLYEVGLCKHRWLSSSTGYRGTKDAIKNNAYDIQQLTLSGTKKEEESDRVKGATEIYHVSSDKVGNMLVDYNVLGVVGAFGLSSDRPYYDVQQYKVNVCSRLMVRKEPSLSSLVIAKLSAGQIVSGQSASDGWNYIETKAGEVGYASAKYLDPIK
ncbi:glycoside hydrolase domain-containing protein [Vibrio ostreicida]|uniref:glycoside hydrolase domain-containing protein n=1 Tax=Vibrio ostreicida TaxID=526588 RepID=UPI003B5C24B3